VKSLGIVLLALGAAIAIYAMNMDVSVTVEARDLGFGVHVPGMTVANLELMSRRQNILTLGGMLAVVGAILTGFATLSQSRTSETSRNESQTEATPVGQDDRVEFHGGKFTVGQRSFNTFEDAQAFLDDAQKRPPPHAPGI
jgi:hypothetical protein